MGNKVKMETSVSVLIDLLWLWPPLSEQGPLLFPEMSSSGLWVFPCLTLLRSVRLKRREYQGESRNGSGQGIDSYEAGKYRF